MDSLGVDSLLWFAKACSCGRELALAVWRCLALRDFLRVVWARSSFFSAFSSCDSHTEAEVAFVVKLDPVFC